MNPENYKYISPKLYQHILSGNHERLKNEARKFGHVSLESWYFTSSQAYAFDINEIIRKSWQFACHVSMLPTASSFVTMNLAGLEVIVLRKKDGEHKAYANTCPHRGARLVNEKSGILTRSMLCPVHGWSFGLDGSLSNIPRWKEDFPHVSKNDCKLHEYAVDIFEGMIFVQLGGDTPPPSVTLEGFREIISYYRIPEMIMSYSPETSEFQANWKLIMENDRNADHIPCIHPEYNDLFGYRGFTEVLYPHGVWHAALPMKQRTPKLWTSRNYHKILPKFEGIPDVLGDVWMNFNLFPNFSFFIHPEAVDIMQIMPAGPNSSIIRSLGLKIDVTSRQIEASRYLAGRLDEAVFGQEQTMLEGLQSVLDQGNFSAGPVSATEYGVLDYNRCFFEIYEKGGLRAPGYQRPI
ncbi:aromatic ring-hydroxylating oxygenase subunit alpha [Pseudomonas sp. M47T1]|uniref:aromatic ring-hydroxylating oxygenase subunit alpha n=1 Tax=Pseudomonas sp. M47T1 TaxID=1179778 RepID=UPI00031DFDEA|nr:aromatic ring-hydroxylating dioxygenase subunit alpha [Pseudomonas sp. M47T1]